MVIKNKDVTKLLETYKEISLLEKIKAALDWDLNVNMPPKGVDGRAAQTTLLTKLVTEKWLDPAFRELVEDVGNGFKPFRTEEKAIVRNLRQLGNFYFKVPKQIILKKSEVTTQAFVAWHEAKKNNDFKVFAPFLEKIVDLERRISGYLGPMANPYDALLNLYEPGLTTKFLESIFTPLQKELSTFISQIKESPAYAEKDILAGKRIDPRMQQKLSEYVMQLMHYNLEEGRLDVSPHPFTTTLDRYDVRITTKYLEDDFRSSYSATVHEAGHALYELGVSPEYSFTPLEGGVSLGIHESQSRFWENQVGRNKLFLEFLAPVFQSLYSDKELTVDNLFRSLNNVNPDFIRIEADEVTYNLHIILRFEIERDLINNKIEVKDIPEVWNEKMTKYLGVTPRTDSEGCLQDVHWSYGSFGYFPTYSLGNLYAAQFTQAMKKEVSFDDSLRKGNLEPILAWFRKNIHVHGGLYYPDELVQKVTGEKLSSKYFLEYITHKYSSRYSL